MTNSPDLQQRFLARLQRSAVDIVIRYNITDRQDFYAKFGRLWRWQRDDTKNLLFLMTDSGVVHVSQHGHIEVVA